MTPTLDTSPAALRALATRIDEYIYVKYLTSRSDMSGPIALKAIATLRAVADEKERGAPTVPASAPAPSVHDARESVIEMGRELAEARYADDPRNAGRHYEVVAEAARYADDLIDAVRAESQAERDTLAAQLATAQRRLAMATEFNVRDGPGYSVDIRCALGGDYSVEIGTVGMVKGFSHPTLNAAFTAAEAYLAAQVGEVGP